ncbi:MAG TPA: hypothetical protein VLN26_00470 [Gaiellaceae bacterium]|nr:hypothetical protein [Gaiellaceae bacterium]
MKLKALMAALLVAGLSASIALAGPPPGKSNGDANGKGGVAVAASTSSSTSSTTSTTATRPGKGKGAAKKPACTPNRQVNLSGTLAADPTGGSFALAVTGGNAFGKSLKGKQLTVDASHAKVVKHGQKTVAALAKGDRVRVKAKACQPVDAAATFVAMQVVVLGAKGSGGGTSSTSSTSSTTSTVAESTTTP